MKHQVSGRSEEEAQRIKDEPSAGGARLTSLSEIGLSRVGMSAPRGGPPSSERSARRRS